MNQIEHRIEKDDLPQLLLDLKGEYKSRPEFVVGFCGYEPFVTTDDAVGSTDDTASDLTRDLFRTAPLLPVFKSVADDIGVPLRLKETNWVDFPEEFDNGDIDTMLEPIIPTRSRPSYVVVPYMQITTNVLLVPERHGDVAERLAELVISLTTRLRTGDVQRDVYKMEVRRLLRLLADMSAGKKIGVTRGVLEHDVLGDFGAPKTSFADPDIRANAIASIEKGDFFLADARSAAAVVSAMRERGRRVRAIDLFQDRLGASCGFAINPGMPGLWRYLVYKCKFQLEEIHDALLREIPPDLFDGKYFRLLNARELLDFPIASYGFQELLSIDTSPGKASDTAAAQQLLAPVERSSAEPLRMANLTLNIEGVKMTLSIPETLAITTDWESTNARRTQLIDKKLSGTIDAASDAELSHLQKLAAAKRQLVMDLPIKELAEIEASLRARNLWTDE